MSNLVQQRRRLLATAAGILFSVSLVEARGSGLRLSSTPFNVGTDVVVTTSAGTPTWQYMLMYDEVPGDSYLGGEWFGLGLSPSFRVVDSGQVPSSGKVECNIRIPDDSSLVGAKCYFQAMEVTATFDAVHTSNRLDITVGDGSGDTRSSVGQFGLTWNFDRAYSVGQFANGDWWVVGPVKVVGIDPASVTQSGRTMHGSVINPPTTDAQGYDSAMYTYPYGYSPDYDPKLNVGLGVSPSNPLSLAPGMTLVSSRSIVDLYDRHTLDTVAVLTVLSAPAPEGSFRPPYCGTDKTIRFNKSQLDYSRFLALQPVDKTPALSSVVAYFEKPWLDHIPNWRGEEYSHPLNNLPSYGREISTRVGQGMLMLNLSFSDAQKEQLLINMVQVGIDCHGILLNGGDDNWPGNGGHHTGRLPLILLAGVVLNDNEMKSVGTKTLPHNGPYHFGEIDQTFFVEETSPGVWNYGYGGYSASDEGLPEWGGLHWISAKDDVKDWYGNGYRRCCTANSWAGYVLASRMIQIKDLWHHNALFDYQDRYMAIEERGSSQRQMDRFTENMWDAYRNDF